MASLKIGRVEQTDDVKVYLAGVLSQVEEQQAKNSNRQHRKVELEVKSANAARETATKPTIGWCTCRAGYSQTRRRLRQRLTRNEPRESWLAVMTVVKEGDLYNLS